MRSLPVARSLVIALIVAMAAVGVADARTRSRPERRASLVWLLANYGVELKKDVIDRLGPDSEELLIDIANTPRDAPRVRVRALAGLALYPSDASFAFLSSLLYERNLIGNEPGLQMRRQAVRSLGRAFGDRGVDDLLELKGDPAPGLRQAVALALGDAGSVRALPLLELWLTTEQDFTVRQAVDLAVNRLHGR